MIQRINESFPKVLELVESGYTIAKALNKLGLNRGKFYEVLSATQKAELQMVKTANAEFGNVWQHGR